MTEEDNNEHQEEEVQEESDQEFSEESDDEFLDSFQDQFGEEEPVNSEDEEPVIDPQELPEPQTPVQEPQQLEEPQTSEASPLLDLSAQDPPPVNQEPLEELEDLSTGEEELPTPDSPTPSSPTPSSHSTIRSTQPVFKMPELGNITIPITHSLKTEADLPRWNAAVINGLEACDLNKYVEEDVPEPATDEAKSIWRRERALVRSAVIQKIDNAVIRLLENNGWTLTEKDPKVTFDLVNEVVPAVSIEKTEQYVVGFVTKTLGDFDSLSTYLSYIQETRKRLITLKCEFAKKIELIFVIRAVEQQYPMQAVLWRQNAMLTWEQLMNHLTQLARDEEPGKKALAVIPKTQEDGNKSGKGKGKGRDNTKVPCPKCSHKIYPNLVHHDACGKHIPPGAVCYHCNPDKAPESWRRNPKNGSATTNVLNNKESGLANPSTTTSNLLFENNFNLACLPAGLKEVGDDNTAFHRGPGPRT